MSWDSVNDPDMQNPTYCDVWIYSNTDGWIEGTCDQYLTGFGGSGSGTGGGDCLVWLENLDCMADFDYVTGLTSCQYSLWFDTCQNMDDMESCIASITLDGTDYVD